MKLPCQAANCTMLMPADDLLQRVLKQKEQRGCIHQHAQHCPIIHAVLLLLILPDSFCLMHFA
jgi:hypothetical protein